ncbi:MAG: Bax inhibitor-1/YccA family protein [Bacilli bacterium]|nr:Bax inhibitor-1/YccA family protein [Bacilli bacterium]
MRYGRNIVFQRANEFYGDNTATLKGVAIKSIIMLLSAILSSILCMSFVGKYEVESTGVVIFGYLISPIITMVLSFVMSYNPLAAKSLAIPYSILEGISIGTLAGIMQIAFGDVAGVLVGLALVITLAFFLGASVLYATGLVRVTTGFRRFLWITLLGVIISSVTISIIGIFSPYIYDVFYGLGNLSLVLAIISVLIAGAYSLITLDNAAKIVEAGLDKNFEWYAAFGIILNLIWLFYEVLRLIIILFGRSSRN